jgi:GGDEF domain-containing protein
MRPDSSLTEGISMNFAANSWTGTKCANDSTSFSAGAAEQYVSFCGTARIQQRTHSVVLGPGMRAFFVAGERMVSAARQRQQAVSLLLMRAPCLPELQTVFGREAAKAAVHAVMQALSDVAGRRGLAARTLPDTFALVMPQCIGAELVMALRRRLGQACCVELDFNQEEVLLVPDVQSSTIAVGDSFAKTYAVMFRAMMSHRHLEELRRDYVRRQREAHTRNKRVPADLPVPPVLPRGVACGQRFPETIAMPLARR